MKSIIWYICLVFALICTLPKQWGLAKRRAKMNDAAYDDYVYAIARKYAQARMKMTGSTFDITGSEHVPKTGAVLFVANHQSNFDIGLFLAFIDRNKGFIAKKELEKIPILHKWMKELRCVLMDRSDIRKSAKAINEGIKILKTGHCLVVFPEGTRSKNGEVGEFKAGALKLATKSKAVIVPVSIKGSQDMMEANKGRIKSAHVNINIHPPIITEGMSREDETALAENLRKIIIKGLE